MNLTLGAIPVGANRCHFRVWAPLHEHVAVHVLTPADRVVPLERHEHGYHEAVLDDVPAGSLYRYRLPNGLEQPDPASRHQPQDVHGPSQVVADEYAWNDAAWTGIPLRDYILYEL